MDLKYRSRLATLKINEVFPEDAGEYVCKATNSLGTKETSCKLTVKGKKFDSYVKINDLHLNIKKITNQYFYCILQSSHSLHG